MFSRSTPTQILVCCGFTFLRSLPITEHFLYVLLGANSIFCQEMSGSRPYYYCIALKCHFVFILGRFILWAAVVKFRWISGHTYVPLRISLAFRHLLFQSFLWWDRQIKKIGIKTSNLHQTPDCTWVYLQHNILFHLLPTPPCTHNHPLEY